MLAGFIVSGDSHFLLSFYLSYVYLNNFQSLFDAAQGFIVPVAPCYTKETNGLTKTYVFVSYLMITGFIVSGDSHSLLLFYLSYVYLNNF